MQRWRIPWDICLRPWFYANLLLFDILLHIYTYLYQLEMVMGFLKNIFLGKIFLVSIHYFRAIEIKVTCDKTEATHLRSVLFIICFVFF